jgi:hypothetical protein
MRINMGQPTASASLGLQSVPAANLPRTVALHFGASNSTPEQIAATAASTARIMADPAYAATVQKYRAQGWTMGTAILKARDEILARFATDLAAKNAASAAANQAAIAANIAAMGPMAASVRAKQLTYQAQGMSEQDAAARAFGEMSQASAASDVAAAAAPKAKPWWAIGGTAGGAAAGFALGGPVGALVGAGVGFVGVEAVQAGIKKLVARP